MFLLFVWELKLKLIWTKQFRRLLQEKSSLQSRMSSCCYFDELQHSLCTHNRNYLSTIPFILSQPSLSFTWVETPGQSRNRPSLTAEELPIGPPAGLALSTTITKNPGNQKLIVYSSLRREVIILGLPLKVSSELKEASVKLGVPPWAI